MSEENFIEVMPSEKKPHDKRFDKMDVNFLPKLPATFLILGQCGSGKSSCLWSLMTKGYVYKSKKGKAKSVAIQLACWNSFRVVFSEPFAV